MSLNFDFDIHVYCLIPLRVSLFTPSNSKWVKVAVSSTTQVDHKTGNLVPVEPQICQSVPMLVSACPGWVCYAEKVGKQ